MQCSWVYSREWHAWLTHIGQDWLGRLAKEGLLNQLTRAKMPRCEPCLADRTNIKPFSKAMRASDPLKLIHSDIYGPMNVKARHEMIYFVTLIDDYSWYGYVYLLFHRYEVLDVFKRFIAKVETQLKWSVKILQIDQGREYLSNMSKEFCEGKRIQW